MTCDNYSKVKEMTKEEFAEAILESDSETIIEMCLEVVE